MGVRIEGDARVLEGERARLMEREEQFAERSAALEDWQAVLENAGEERERLERDLAAVDAELKALRTEAADEVGEARTTLEGLLETQTEQQRAHDGAESALGEARTELARLEGETPLLRERAAGLDLDALRTARDAAREALAALPPVEEGTDADALREEAGSADRSIRDLESELRRAAGALEQTGGQHLDEQREQAQEAAQALARREQELELDYQAWQLLQETLREAEQAGSAHLGSALVQPVSERIAGLTAGRYGDLALGPQLDATGIELGIELAGSEREFGALSVGNPRTDCARATPRDRGGPGNLRGPRRPSSPRPTRPAWSGCDGFWRRRRKRPPRSSSSPVTRWTTRPIHRITWWT